MRRLTLVLLAGGALLAPAGSALGAPGQSFALKAIDGGSGGYFVLDGRPGATLTGTVLVVNAGHSAGTARLDGVDAVTGATTGAVYQTVGTTPHDVGAWLQLDRHEVTLEPGASARVGFTVTVPAGARRGEHLGGIVAAPLTRRGRNAGNGGDRRSFRVDVVNQSILAVQVDLPGAARQLLKVRGVRAGGQPGYQTVVLTLSNPGERMVRGTGLLEILRDGATVARQHFTIDTFLPRTRIDYPVVMRGKALVPGDYRARVVLDWGAGRDRGEVPFSLTRRNIEQAFGSGGLAKLPGAEPGGGTSAALIAGIAIVALLLGLGAALLVMRRHTRRIEERILRRHAETLAGDDPEARFSHGEEPAQRRRSRR